VFFIVSTVLWVFIVCFCVLVGWSDLQNCPKITYVLSSGASNSAVIYHAAVQVSGAGCAGQSAAAQPTSFVLQSSVNQPVIQVKLRSHYCTCCLSYLSANLVGLHETMTDGRPVKWPTFNDSIGEHLSMYIEKFSHLISYCLSTLLRSRCWSGVFMWKWCRSDRLWSIAACMYFSDRHAGLAQCMEDVNPRDIEVLELKKVVYKDYIQVRKTTWSVPL